ncbi:MAG: hypothetical protein ABIH67_05165 [Candidatus Uhrbacteria bacterium]
MQSKKLAKAKPGPPTQRYLDIAEIRENVVVLKDGTLRAVIMVSSINFALKSEDEQNAIVQAYMAFLNGIDFPLQIVIQSRSMDIDSYIGSIRQERKKIENDALQMQIDDYLSFIQELVSLGEIMQKRFYIVIPYDPATNKSKTFWQRLSIAVSPVIHRKINEKQFQDRRSETVRRAEMIIGQLNSMGIEGVALDTQGLIELYYTVYNPDIFDSQKMPDISKMQVEE